MEQLPIEIEKKINDLPIIPFDGNDDFQNIIFSQNFTDIFNFYKENYLPDVLKSKSELYQRMSLYLTLTNQDLSFLEQTEQVLYRRPCPTIEEFLNNKFYMGYSNATLYPYWREQLCKMFAEGSPVRKVIFSGCLGCLTKDTKIATLNGDKTIGELLNNFDNEWVLSYNTTNNAWEPDKILDVFYSGYKDIYEITLDNGEIIKCTDNHKFLSRKNKWVSIKDNTLIPGLSMMPYYTRYNKAGYLQVKNNKTEKWESRYVTVGKWKNKHEKGIAIHHKNYNKLDDRPENLCLLTVNQHYMFHAKKGGDNWKRYNQSIRGEEFKELRREKVLKGRDTYRSRPDYPEKKAIRVKWWKETMLTKEHQQKASYSVWHGKNAEQNKLQSAQRITLRNKTEKARNTSKCMAANMRRLKQQKTPEELKIIYAKQGLSSLKRHKGINSKEYQEKLTFIRTKEPWYNPELGAKANHKLKKTYNHKVVSIKYIGKEDVYDITTEKNHNFALTAGIVAHNCGKSTVARKAFLYVLYRIMCLRYPRSTFNVDADATIANVVIATTLKQVYDVNMLPFVKLMETMPCFQRVMSQRSFENFNLDDPHCPIPFVLEKSSGTVYFPDNIILTSGSQATHFTGMNVINSFCFTGNMKVYTNYGIITFKSLLNQFKNGIRPSTYCINKDGIKEKVKIIDVKETRKVTELLRIYYDDERYIECTPDHPFVINNPKENDQHILYENGIAYKQAQYLTEEDDIASEDQAYVYSLIDNRPDSKGFNQPFYIGISAHENTMANAINVKYIRPYSHFTKKSLKVDTNPIKKAIIESILNQNLKPEIKILKTNLSLEEACTLEKQLIKQHGKIIDHTGNLANITDGGEGVLLITPEIIERKSKKIRQTKAIQKKEKMEKQIAWLSNIMNLYIAWNIIEGKRLIANYRKKLAATKPEKIAISSKHMREYNRSQEHKKRTAELNHLYPKISSLESRKKLSKSQSLTWNKKTLEQKKKDNLSKSIGRAWNVLSRVSGQIINEQIFNSHRSKGSRLANTEPLWKSIIEKSGSVDVFLDLIEEKFGRRFIYEN